MLENKAFAIETTHSARIYEQVINLNNNKGYTMTLQVLWLLTVELRKNV